MDPEELKKLEEQLSRPTDEESERSFSDRVKLLIRVAAGVCLLIAALDLTAAVLAYNKTHTYPSISSDIGIVVTLVVGIALLVKTNALTEYVEEWLDL